MLGYWASASKTGRESIPGELHTDAAQTPIGTTGEVELRDRWGSMRMLSSLRGKRATVLAFLGANCPASQQVTAQLKHLSAQYREGDISFVAVYCQPGDNLERAAGHACEHDLSWTVVVDQRGTLARRWGVQQTPSLGILTESDTPVCVVAIGDNTHARVSKDPRGAMALILDSVLQNRVRPEWPPSSTGTALAGASTSPADRNLTYARDVAPLLHRHCQPCHRSGQTAPFELSTYEDAVRWSEMIREVVAERRMPPWHADPRFGHFSNDRRMSDDEVATLVAWVDAGTPPGDLSELPSAPRWPVGWYIGEPDKVVEFPPEFHVPEDGTVLIDYLHVTKEDLSAVFDRERWVTAAELRPSNPAVVHHLALYLVPLGELADVRVGLMAPLAVWVPGTAALEYPQHTALRVPAGSSLLLEAHHTPNGMPGSNRISLALKYTETAPTRELIQRRAETRTFRIPPGAPHQRSEAVVSVERDMLLHAMIPHMHLRGKDCTVLAEFSDDRTETLLMVPRYDFNWQTLYTLTEPVPLPVGAKLRAVVHWDNSAANARNPDASKSVTYGQQSTDEMMGVGLYLSVPWSDAGRGTPVAAGMAGATAEALAQAMAAADENPQDVDAQRNVAEALFAARDFAGARTRYDKVLELRSDDLAAHLGLARLDSQESEFERAELHLRRASEIAPDDFAVWNDLGVLLVRLDRAAEAETCYARARELAPDVAVVEANRAAALLKLGRLEESLTAARRSIELDATLADGHLHLGLALARLARHEEAFAALGEANRLRPDHAETLNAQGGMFYATGQLDEALEKFDRALALSPQYAEARCNRGLILARRGEYELARVEFEAAIRGNSALVDAHFYLGVCHAQRGDAEGTIAAYRQVLKLRPDSAPARNNLAWLLATHPEDRIRDGNEAVALSEAALEGVPSTNYAAYDTYAAALAAAARFAEAVRAMERALELARDRVSDTTFKGMQERLQLYQSGQAYRDYESW